jgi:hypothetical protein
VSLSRRTVTTAAAWAAPAVLTAVGAPAYAAGSIPACTDRGSDLLDQGLGRQVTGLWFGNDEQADVVITATDAAGNTISAGSDTGKLARTTYSPRWNYITLHHAKGMKQGDTITLTLRFTPRPVRDFTATITAIDKVTGEWIDEVVVSPAPVGVVTRGSAVSGSGTVADPFTSDVDKAIKDAAGDVTLLWPGPLTQVQIRYVAADLTNASPTGQRIGVGRFAYDNCG